jgi:hypothetical protein
MNILMITENDPAGMGISFANGINRYTEHACRLITTTTKYNFSFEKDIHIPDLDEGGFEEVSDLLKKADIIHFHILADESIKLGPVKVKDFVNGKSILHHHHGHPDFRANPEKYRGKYRMLKRKVLVSTPDLLRSFPESIWQPNVVPINSPPYLPQRNSANGRVRICHSPTRKYLKNTAEFEAVVASLQKKYHILERVIIENRPHAECLKIKQSCDIHFDHMQGYFGVSSLEGLSQGNPVIAGLDEWNVRCLRTYAEADRLPWVIAHTPAQLKEKIRHLVVDKEWREAVSRESRRFMETCWNDKKIIGTLMKVYETL